MVDGKSPDQVALLIRSGIIRMAARCRVCGRGWRRQLMEWVDLGLERSENLAIYRKRLSRQEAWPALASKQGGTFTADGCHYF